MRLMIFTLLLVVAAPAMAFPMMKTKEKVRLELWFHGLESKTVQKPQQEPVKRLPIELEQALLKF